MSQDLTPVTVHILDKEYRIACTAEERQGLLDSARLIDQRMREVRQNGRVIGADRIAVMAALNIIYELTRECERQALAAHRLKLLQDRVTNALNAARAHTRQER